MRQAPSIGTPYAVIQHGSMLAQPARTDVKTGLDKCTITIEEAWVGRDVDMLLCDLQVTYAQLITIPTGGMYGQNATSDGRRLGSALKPVLKSTGRVYLVPVD